MPLLDRIATSVAPALLVLASVPALGVESVQEESESLAFAEPEQLSDPLVQDQMLQPSINTTGDAFVSTRATTNWGFDAEVLVLHTDYASVDFSEVEGDDKAAAGFRFTLGWESDAGYGIRARLAGMGIEGSVDGVSIHGHDSPAGPVFEGFDYLGVSPTADSSRALDLVTATWDIDLYKHFANGGSDVVVGAGLRNAILRAETPQVMQNTVATGGVSLFSELRQVVYRTERSEWALVGGGRVSFLTGEWESQIPGDMIQVDTDMTISEGSLGMEWSRAFRKRVLILRAQYEYQRWNSDATSDVTFNGAALRTGLGW
jgi:hypothetical protein